MDPGFAESSGFCDVRPRDTQLRLRMRKENSFTVVALSKLGNQSYAIRCTSPVRRPPTVHLIPPYPHSLDTGDCSYKRVGGLAGAGVNRAFSCCLIPSSSAPPVLKITTASDISLFCFGEVDGVGVVSPFAVKDAMIAGVKTGNGKGRLKVYGCR